MIQRKQTLFLLAAALLCGLSFLQPVASYRAPDPSPSYALYSTGLVDLVNATEVVDVDLKYPLHLIYILLGAVCLVDVFLFKNRKRQLLVLRSAYILGVLLIVFQLVTHQSVSAYLGEGRELSAQVGPVMFFPLGILLFMFLAQRGIQKDEELVRSTERLR